MSSTTLLALVARCRSLCRPRSSAADAELLTRFVQQRDPAAFEELLERYAPLVWGVCRRIAVAEVDAEDAFQATFLALLRQADRLDSRQPLAGWLHTVASRLARKAQARLRRHQALAEPSPTTTEDIADAVGEREVRLFVDEEIDRLPATLREPLILCCLLGRTRDEAAQSLGCSVAAVKGRLERGRELLRRRLQRRGVELPAAFLALTLTGERIRAALWAKTMQAALYTPAPAIAALAEGAIPALSLGKYKLAAIALFLAMGTAGALGQAFRAKPQETPTPPLAAKAPLTQPSSQRGQGEKPQASQVRTDRHGDPLPEGAIARLGTVRWKHGNFVHALAYSPDGKTIATVGGGRHLVLWDAATGKELRSFPGRGQPRGVAFAPDGRTIATIQRFGQLWDVATGEMRELKNVQSGVAALAFAPDGKTLATANFDAFVHLWDPKSCEEKRRIACGQGELFSLAYTPDGKLLASSGNDGTIRLWDAATGREVRRITNSKQAVGPVVFSPDGKQLAAGSREESLRLWDVTTGKHLRSFGDKDAGFTPIAFSPDGKLLAAGYGDGTFRMWDAAGGEEKRRWHAGVGLARSLAFSPDGKTLATSVLWDGCTRLWDVETGRERFAVEGHHGPITSLRFGADKNTLISAGFDQNALWWDLTTQTPRRQFTWKSEDFMRFALSPDGNTAAVVGDKQSHELWLWDVRTGKSVKLPGELQEEIHSIAFSPDGRLVASAGKDGAIHIWNVRDKKEVRRIKGSAAQNSTMHLLFSPDGKTVASGARGFPNNVTGRLWDVASGKEHSVFADQLAGECPAAFSSDGKVLATVNDPPGNQVEYLIRLWDTTTGKELCRYNGHRISVVAVAFSPNGKLVVSGGGGDQDNSIQVREAATGRLIRRFECHHSWVFAVAFAADGLTVASSAGDSTILLWDITRRQKDGKLSPLTLTPKQLDACWSALANDDAAKAYDAVWTLAAAPEQAVPFLKKHLPPAPRPDDQAVARWIADLDSDSFMVRQNASKELAKLGDTLTPALHKALADKPPLEMRRRLQQLLDQSRAWTPERLRHHRAIQVLEHMRTPAAREALQTLADGTPQTQRTDEAKAALRRIE
jgi:RNA polymerase sigma factor (sigma-70 family)